MVQKNFDPNNSNMRETEAGTIAGAGSGMLGGAIAGRETTTVASGTDLSRIM